MYKLTRLSSKNKNLPSTSPPLPQLHSSAESLEAIVCLPILSDPSFPFNPVQSSGLHFHCSTEISLTKFASDFYIAKCQGHFRSSLNAATVDYLLRFSLPCLLFHVSISFCLISVFIFALFFFSAIYPSPL